MSEGNVNEDKNINRRNFLKKIAMTTVFAVPTIQSFKLLAKGKSDWTAHGHGNKTPPPPPPSPY
jgi:hypothetical protein